MDKTQHTRASVVNLGVAQLAVVVQARANRATRPLGQADLTTVVAAAPVGFDGFIAPRHPSSDLGDFLPSAQLPISYPFAGNLPVCKWAASE